MSEWIVIIILAVFILIIAWIGNGISDRISDSFRNDQVRRENAANRGKQEMLSDRYK